MNRRPSIAGAAIALLGLHVSPGLARDADGVRPGFETRLEEMRARIAGQLEACLRSGRQQPVEPEGATARKERAGARPASTVDRPEVAHFRRYFRESGRATLETAVRRLRKYDNVVRPILREEGLPEWMIYLPIVESLYDPKALSRAGARGLWQFMPETARRYGLELDAPLDEREDPARSTRAAARYLRELHRTFGDWPLALAAYNGGENRVSRAMRRAGTTDFWRLAARGWLPQETRDYVPALFAVVSLLDGRGIERTELE